MRQNLVNTISTIKAATELGFVIEQHCTLQVMQSQAGYFIGTFDESDFSVSRESLNYYKTRELAEDALESGKWALYTEGALFDALLRSVGIH